MAAGFCFSVSACFAAGFRFDACLAGSAARTRPAVFFSSVTPVFASSAFFARLRASTFSFSFLWCKGARRQRLAWVEGRRAWRHFQFPSQHRRRTGHRVVGWLWCGRASTANHALSKGCQHLLTIDEVRSRLPRVLTVVISFPFGQVLLCFSILFNDGTKLLD